MTANRAREHVPSSDYHPFEEWFWCVAWLAETKPLRSMAYIYFEIDCAQFGADETDNIFVANYKDDEFSLEEPDD